MNLGNAFISEHSLNFLSPLIDAFYKALQSNRLRYCDTKIVRWWQQFPHCQSTNQSVNHSHTNIVTMYNWHTACIVDNADGNRIQLASLTRTGEDNQDVPASCGRAPSNRIWDTTTLRSPKQQIWLRTALCGGWCQCMAQRNLEVACQKRRLTKTYYLLATFHCWSDILLTDYNSTDHVTWKSPSPICGDPASQFTPCVPLQGAAKDTFNGMLLEPLLVWCKTFMTPVTTVFPLKETNIITNKQTNTREAKQ